MIWWLVFEKKPLQFWREIWIQVVVILLQLYEFGISYKFCEPNVGFFFFLPTFSRLVLVFSLWFFVRCPIFVLLLSETKTSFSETAKFFKSWWLMRISSLLDDDGGDSSETIPSSSVLSSVFDSLSGISPKKRRKKSWNRCPSTCSTTISRDVWKWGSLPKYFF